MPHAAAPCAAAATLAELRASSEPPQQAAVRSLTNAKYALSLRTAAALRVKDTARLALGRASAKPDRHGGFKAVYFDEDRVLAVTKPLRASTARQALIELLVPHAQDPAVAATLRGLAGVVTDPQLVALLRHALAG